MMYEKRLHPASIVFQFFGYLKDAAIGFLPVLFIIFSSGASWYEFAGVGLLLVILLIFSIVKWFRFSYVVTEEELQIKQGIFVRRERRISKHRIQSIDLTQNLLHRIFGLTKVQIETAGSDENVDASLAAVTFEEGERVSENLKHKGERTEEDHEKAYPEEVMSYSRLALTGATSDNAIIIFGLLWLLFSQANQIIPDQMYEDATRWLFSLAVQFLISLVLLSVLVVWGAGIIWTMVKYANFTITRYETELYMKYGLIEKRQRTIPVNRIQAVIVKENLIRQLLGLCYVYVEVAGGVNGGKMEGSTVYLLPLLKKNDVPGFLNEYLPEYYRDTPGMKRPPLRSLPYYIWGSLLVSVTAVIVVSLTVPAWVLIPVAATVIFPGWGVFRWRTSGISFDETYLNLQYRKVSRETVTLRRARLQAFGKKDTWLYRKQGLATIDAAILNNAQGRHFVVPALWEEDVAKASETFSKVPGIHKKLSEERGG
ncbi:PH domain-containing protein [Salimicrobium jeotgali]|uniref:PH domain-containing protein n=1 Tax=Salimicrobium jeotgali TaxID=1230341 RepID=UPI000C839FAC|nr:PH domain-containing protein [Salimicrobium jeotgali]